MVSIVIRRKTNQIDDSGNLCRHPGLLPAANHHACRLLPHLLRYEETHESNQP